MNGTGWSLDIFSIHGSNFTTIDSMSLSIQTNFIDYQNRPQTGSSSESLPPLSG